MARMLVSGAVLAAAPLATLAATPALTPPAGWAAGSTAGMRAETLGIWFSPKAPTAAVKQTITFSAFPTTMSLDDYVTAGIQRYSARNKTFALVWRTGNHGCPAGASEIADFKTTSRTGVPLETEQSYMERNGNIYIATYARAAADLADPAAERALDAVCP